MATNERVETPMPLIYISLLAVPVLGCTVPSLAFLFYAVGRLPCQGMGNEVTEAVIVYNGLLALAKVPLLRAITLVAFGQVCG